MLVLSTLHWWAGVGNDQSIGDCISGCRKVINIEQKLAEKKPLGLKYIVPMQLHATRKLHVFISTP